MHFLKIMESINGFDNFGIPPENEILDLNPIWQEYPSAMPQKN